MDKDQQCEFGADYPDDPNGINQCKSNATTMIGGRCFCALHGTRKPKGEIKSPSSSCSLESDVKSLWRSLSAPIGSGGGLYTEGYQKARAEMKLAIGQILITHKEN